MAVSRTKKFNDLFYDKNQQALLEYGKHFEKIKYCMHRIRKIMIRENPSFDKLSLLNQFNFCHTIYMMNIQGNRSLIKEISYINKNNDDELINKYDIEFGFKEPDYVNALSKESNTVLLIENL